MYVHGGWCIYIECDSGLLVLVETYGRNIQLIGTWLQETEQESSLRIGGSLLRDSGVSIDDLNRSRGHDGAARIAYRSGQRRRRHNLGRQNGRHKQAPSD